MTSTNCRYFITVFSYWVIQITVNSTIGVYQFYRFAIWFDFVIIRFNSYTINPLPVHSPFTTITDIIIIIAATAAINV